MGDNTNDLRQMYDRKEVSYKNGIIDYKYIICRYDWISVGKPFTTINFIVY